MKQEPGNASSQESPGFSRGEKVKQGAILAALHDPVPAVPIRLPDLTLRARLSTGPAPALVVPRTPSARPRGLPAAGH